jgi:hypothetical protein
VNEGWVRQSSTPADAVVLPGFLHLERICPLDPIHDAQPRNSREFPGIFGHQRNSEGDFMCRYPQIVVADQPAAKATPGIP